MKRSLPELLAPAGSLKALLAALAAGADAVYIGLGSFNARASAPDIELDDFARACALAHERGARVYVTENVYLREGELDDALALARAAYRAGADALIVADAGFARLLGRALPDLEIHLSTQAGAMSAEAVELAVRELGAARVTCARELSVDEIARLAATGVPIEAFCHGAICICYAGACAFSALRRGRSANRGDCTQPCRLAYALEDGGGRRVDAAGGDRLLCPRDYLSVRHLAELVDAGVAALKIEGRMKNPDYVYNVVRAYREALDALAGGGNGAGGPASLDTAALDDLEFRLGRSFNRGFTDAYLRGRSGSELMSPQRAINQGVRVGTVVERGHHEVVVALDAPVEAGDTLEIRTVLPADAPADVPARCPLVTCEVDGVAGERIRVRCKRRVGVGSPVHLTASAHALADAAAAVDAMRARFDAVPVPSERVEGDRRDAPAAVAEPVGAAVVQPVPVLRTVRLVASPAEAIAALDDADVHEVAVCAWRLPDDPAWEELLPRLTVVLDEVCRAADLPRVRRLCERADAVVCRNLGQLDVARAAGVPFDAAAPLSATNAETVLWLVGIGARRVWLPDELSASEIERVVHAAPAGSVGVAAGGDAQLMVCEHCLLLAEGPCDGDHAHCARRRADRFLVEASGACLPVAVDALGRTRIFNDAALDRTPELDALIRAGIAAIIV
ncbi:U32 family peptidase [Collinsella tanakaei]|uniref:U32 family peptidase n=1 Tax=Collinsella tanakaei TaxID=626935 RepID=UPI0025A40C2B|nr:U32 family peptidase [Collinsella tanakaei]MDM8300063.1 U32 family peptidase [Collinsella tanakaei]